MAYPSRGMKKRPAVLAIFDGWGVAPPGPGNAITLAATPQYSRLREECPSTDVSASGEDVGLPAGQMGNSEVGHLNIGAGRMVPQDILRINLAIRDGSFFRNPAFLEACARVAGNSGTLHLLGLLSDGGVHSHQDHLFALLELARREKLERVRVHPFLDGRDTPPQSAGKYIATLERAISKIGVGEIATIGGRYWAMDRDNRWERVERAYAAIVSGRGRTAPGAEVALADAYERGETDEFVEPTVIHRRGEPIGTIQDGDAVIVFNFRADRARQLTLVLTAKEFSGFDRGTPPDAALVCMTEYKEELGLPVAFPPMTLPRILAQVWEEAAVQNLRLAETEKYAHVTYFFNGGVEKEFGGETRLLVPSRNVATYDLEPKMAAAEITEKALQAISSGRFDAIVMNYANADMVGHTGRLAPTVQAIEYLDMCIGTLTDAVLDAGGALLLTADHGNAEQMIDPRTGEPHTAHTTNPVPFILVAEGESGSLRQGGSLRDVAPTMLGLMGLDQPPEMTGRDLRKG